MKRIMIFLLIFALLSGLSGCSRSDLGQISLPWAPTESADHDVIWATGAYEETYETLPPPEEIVRAQLAPCLDVSPYDDAGYQGPVLAEPIREIRVQGVKLYIGMSYQELIAAGLVPELEDLAESEAEGMLSSFNFTAPNGKTVALDLWAPAGSTYGESTLSRMEQQGEDMDFHVAGIGEDFTLDMILDILGAPTGLRINASRSRSNVMLEYRFQDANGCLRFVIDPENGSITRVDLWGSD